MAEAEPVSVYVECTTGTTLVIAKKAFRQDLGNSSPGKTVAPSLHAAIGQSVSGIGQENTLSISLRTNFDLLVCWPWCPPWMMQPQETEPLLRMRLLFCSRRRLLPLQLPLLAYLALQTQIQVPRVQSL